MESLKSLLKHAADIDRQGQIQNLKDLLEVLEKGDLETAKAWVKAAIKLLEKNGE